MRSAYPSAMMLALLACSAQEFTVFPATLPDSGASRVELRGLPSGLLFVDLDDQTLALQPEGLNYRLEVPRLSVGEHLLSADGYEARIQVVPGALKVSFLDVGQGDATLIQSPAGTSILIDSGPPGSGPRLRQALSDRGVSRIDLAIATHMDADHVGGFAELVAGNDGSLGTLDDLTVLRWRDSGDALQCTSQACAAYRAVAQDRAQIEAVDDLPLLGGFSLTTLARAGEVLGRGIVPGDGQRPASTEDDNARSVVLRASLGGLDLLLMGDLTGGGLGTPNVEALLIDQVQGIEVLKAGHHGSRTSSSAVFVAAVSPQVSVLSFGTDNPHCHPVQEVLDRLAATGWVYGTGEEPAADCGASQWPERGRSGCGDIELASHHGANFVLRCADVEQGF